MTASKLCRKPFSILQGNRNYFRFTLVLFVLGLAAGAAFPEILQQVVANQIEHIKQLANEANGDPSKLSWVIFKNNLTVSLMMIATGIFLSVFPMFMVTMNGLAIGFLFAQWGTIGQIPLWAIILFGILPHGIFEIPAFLLAGASGIKLGYMWIRPLKGKTRPASVGYAGKEMLYVLPIIVGLLVIAAYVEGHVTPLLLEWYVTK